MVLGGVWDWASVSRFPLTPRQLRGALVLLSLARPCPRVGGPSWVPTSQPLPSWETSWALTCLKCLLPGTPMWPGHHLLPTPG